MLWNKDFVNSLDTAMFCLSQNLQEKALIFWEDGVSETSNHEVSALSLSWFDECEMKKAKYALLTELREQKTI